MTGRAPAGARLIAELLGDLAVAPRAGGAPLVVPIVHDELALDLPMLQAAVERYNGIWLDGDDGAPSAGDPAPELVDATRRVFAHFELPVDIEVGQRVAVRSEGGAPADESLHRLHRVAERLLSDPVRAHPLAVLSFGDVGLSSRRRELLWALTVQQIPRLLAGEIRVLAPVWIGTVDVDLHCTGQPSLRYAIRRGSLHVRRSSENLQAAVGRIIRDPDEPIVLFLGAGFSASARLSLGDDVRDDAIATVLNAAPGSEGLIERFRRWIVDVPIRQLDGEAELSEADFAARLTLERVLREEFRALREDRRPRSDSAIVQRLTKDCAEALDRWPEARSALHQLAELLPRLVIVTVNFDELVESDAPIEIEVFTPAHDFGGAVKEVKRRLTAGDGATPVVKLHGTIADADTLVADVTDTRLGLPAPAAAVLDSLLEFGGRPLTWVFVGCSMRDIDVTEWLRNRSGRDDLREWWVDPLPGRSLESFIEVNRTREQERIVDYLGERLLTETADAFLTALRDHARALR